MAAKKKEVHQHLADNLGKLHDLKSLCDLCGLEADSEVAEVVALDCSYMQCPPEAELYHQACLEKYLKSIRCERNRKIGFPCPRGCGKGTRFPESCKGKIQKSHPVTIRSEGNKKRRQAELEHLQRTISADKEAEAKGKAAKKEEAAKAASSGVKGKDKKAAAHAAAVEAKAKAKAAPAAKPATVKALNVANTSITQQPLPKSAAQLNKEAMAAERDRIRAQLAPRGAGGAPPPSNHSACACVTAAPLPRERAVKTLDEYLAERSGSSSSTASALERSASVASSVAAAAAAPSINAWARARANSGASLAGGDSSDPLSHPPSRAATPSGQQPAPAPQGAWAQHEAGSGSDHLPPLPPPAGSGAAAVLGEGDSADHAGRAIPGMEAAPPDKAAAQPLTKAQRKNLRRAEKKAAGHKAEEPAQPGSLYTVPHSQPALAVRTADRSHLSDAPFTVADAAAVLEMSAPLAGAVGLGRGDYGSGRGGGGGGGPMDMFDQCMQLVVQHKLQQQVAQLEALGFPGPAAVAAVRSAGGNLAAAVESLLAPGGAAGMAAEAAWSSGGRDVDVSEELSALNALRDHYRLAAGVVEAITVDCGGDLEAVALALAKQCGPPAARPLPQYQQQQMPAAHDVAGSLFGTQHLQQMGHQYPHQHQAEQQAHTAASLGWGAPEAHNQCSSGYSAFGFGGLTEVALSAVHSGTGAGGGSLFTSSLDGTTSQQSAGTPLQQRDLGNGTSLWAEFSNPTTTSPPEAGLLAMLGVGGGPNGSAGGGFPGLQPGGQPPFDLGGYNPASSGLHDYGSQKQQQAAMHTSLCPEQQHQQWGNGYGSGGGGLWGVQGGGSVDSAPGLFGAPPVPAPQSTQSQELSDLMASLMCN